MHSHLPPKLDPIRQGLLREFARRVSEGLSAEQIARQLDYPQNYVEQTLLTDDFREFFEAELPEAYALWRRTREEEEVDVEVQHFLQSKALSNAKKLQQLADSGELRPADELRARENLLKMSGKIKEDDVVEVVKISHQHLAALTGTAAELDESIEETTKRQKAAGFGF